MKGFQRAFARLAVALCSVFIPLSVVAAPGDLDTTFNTTGRVLTSFGGVADIATAAIVQPDRKIVVVGYCSIQGDDDFCVARYLPNGQLDQNFGANGKVTTIIGTGNDRARAVALQPDGKIVVAGDCVAASGFRNICVVRYLSNGGLDTGFDSDGKLIFSAAFGQHAQVNGIAITSDYSILLVGEGLDPSNNATYGVISLRSANGSLITGGNFGTFDANSLFRFTGAALQIDGKAVVVGQILTLDGRQRLIARLLAGGVTFDNTFDGNGLLTLPLSSTGPDKLDSVAIQPDGAIIVSGVCADTATSSAVCLKRINTNGTVDTTFGNEAASTKFRESNARGVLALLADGKIAVAAPCTTLGGSIDACTARFHSDGKFDSGFSVDGKESLLFSTSAPGYAEISGDVLATQADGKIIVGGACRLSAAPTVKQFCLFRYEGGPGGYRACSLDLDGDGSVLATTDALMMTRISLGMTGNAVTGGITFPSGATRLGWTPIRNYLVSQCGMNLAP
jgi:uncharacterized delta-60 repeat protein